jgi:RNA polymerase sigma-70 factor (ECF subfamily)
MTLAPDLAARFQAALEPHRGILYKVARGYGRSAADREDIVQETVIQLWRAFPKYDPAFKFSTWMYRIALNVAISWRRRERTQTQHLHPEGGELLEGLAAATSAAEAEHDDLALLYTCIARYNDLDRALLMLHLDGQSHAEIASVLGITATNAATKLGRLKDRLREDFCAAGHI